VTDAPAGKSPMELNHYEPEQLLNMAIAPAPWYWKTFPKIVGKSGTQYAWRLKQQSGLNPCLAEENRPDSCRLILKTYTRVFSVPPYYFAVWSQTDGTFHIDLFDPDGLPEFNVKEAFADPDESEAPYLANGSPLESVSFSKALKEGVHNIRFSPLFKSVEKPLLAVDSWDDGMACHRDENAIYAIYELDPRKDSVRVDPQKWFVGKHFDIGYEWITRVIRVPGTDTIIGDGIRIGAFKLAEDRQHMKRWLSDRYGSDDWRYFSAEADE